MSFPKARYNLHPRLPIVVEMDNGFYMGSHYCRKNLQPTDYERVLPALPNIGVYQTMPIRGRGACNPRAASAGLPQRNPGGVASMLGLPDEMYLPFSSTSGATIGRRFIIVAGVLCEVLTTDELIQVKNLLALNPSNGYQAGAIFDESPSHLFIVCAARESSISGVSSDEARRVMVMSVSKTDYSVTQLITEAYYAYGPMHTSGASCTYMGQIENVHGFMFSSTNNADAPAVRTIRALYVDVQNNTAYSPAAVASDTLFKNQFLSSYSSKRVVLAGEETNPNGYFYVCASEANPLVGIYAGEFERGNALLTANPRTSMRLCEIIGAPEGFTIDTAVVSGALSSGGTSTACPLFTQSGSRRFITIAIIHSALTLHETAPQVDTSRLGFYTFEIDNEDASKLTYISHTTDGFSYGQRIIDFVTDGDNKTLIVSNSNGFGVLSWSEEQCKFMPTPWRAVPGGVRRLNLDLNGQIWVEDANSSVFVFDLTRSAQVRITFDRDKVIYSGQTVPMTITVDALNYSGDRISRSVRLAATGCTFEDGQQGTTIQTNDREGTVVPVFINGGGRVTVEGYFL